MPVEQPVTAADVLASERRALRPDEGDPAGRRARPRNAAPQCPLHLRRRNPERHLRARGDPGAGRARPAPAARLPLHGVRRWLHRQLAHRLGEPGRGGRECGAATAPKRPGAGGRRGRPDPAPAGVQQLPLPAARGLLHRPLDPGGHGAAEHPPELAGPHPAPDVRADDPPPVPVPAGVSRGRLQRGRLQAVRAVVRLGVHSRRRLRRAGAGRGERLDPRLLGPARPQPCFCSPRASSSSCATCPASEERTTPASRTSVASWPRWSGRSWPSWRFDSLHYLGSFFVAESNLAERRVVDAAGLRGGVAAEPGREPPPVRGAPPAPLRTAVAGGGVDGRGHRARHLGGDQLRPVQPEPRTWTSPGRPTSPWACR